jgi:hypothetical protein
VRGDTDVIANTVIFEGTLVNNLEEILNDADQRKDDADYIGTVHRGFLRSFQSYTGTTTLGGDFTSTYPPDWIFAFAEAPAEYGLMVLAGTPTFITGNSLGGAHSQMLSSMLLEYFGKPDEVYCFSFGTPNWYYKLENSLKYLLSDHRTYLFDMQHKVKCYAPIGTFLGWFSQKSGPIIDPITLYPIGPHKLVPNNRIVHGTKYARCFLEGVALADPTKIGAFDKWVTKSLPWSKVPLKVWSFTLGYVKKKGLELQGINEHFLVKYYDDRKNVDKTITLRSYLS